MEDADSQRIGEFWSWLTRNSVSLNRLSNPNEPFWDEIQKRLEAVSAGLRFEISDPHDGVRELVVTTDANPTYIPFADRLIASAPEISGWSFVSLKQPQGFDFAFDIDGIHVDPSTMCFLPMLSDSDPSLLGLRVAVPGYSFIGSKKAKIAGWLALLTGLGERVLAQRFVRIEFCAPPRSPDDQGYMPLHDLPIYIEYRERKAREAT